MSLELRSLSERLAEVLRERILTGAYDATQSLRQDALAGELGVSKIPLREALAKLEREGLVRAEANRGWFVTPLSAAEAEEVFALRLAIEPEAARRGARHANGDEQAAARAALTALDAELRARGPRVGALNRAFHLALVAPAGRAITHDVLARLHIVSERYVRAHLEPRERAPRARAEHAALLEAWLARDGRAVARLTRAHVAGTLADLRAQFAAGRS